MNFSIIRTRASRASTASGRTDHVGGRYFAPFAAVLILLLAGCTSAGGETSSPGASEPATSTQISNTEFLANFDLSAGQTPENIVAGTDGSVDVTFASARQVAHIDEDGQINVTVTVPAPADGGVNTPVQGFPVTLGIERVGDVIYFLYAEGSARTGLYRIDDQQAEQISELPADSLPNGLAWDKDRERFLIADSASGAVWTVSANGGAATVWVNDPSFAPVEAIGINGIKVHDGAVWVSNTDTGSILQIDVTSSGDAGEISTFADGLSSVDDFAFTGNGNEIVATLNASSTLVLVNESGESTEILTTDDGLQNPTAAAVQDGLLVVTSAAYATMTDPNLLISSIEQSAD